MRPVQIITDSCADIDQSIRTRYGIDYARMKTICDGKEQWASLDFEYYTPKEFYDTMRAGNRILTAQVSPEEFDRIFRMYLEEGKDIVYIGCSSKQSGSVNTGAVVAKKLSDCFPEASIFCVDSLNATMGEGMLAVRAAEYRDKGLDAKAIAEHITADRKLVNEYCTVHNLDTFRRSGRVKASAAFFGNLFGVKPIIISDKDGYQTPIKKVKGRQASIREIVALLKDSVLDAENQCIYIAHADCAEEAEMLRQLVEREIPCREIHVGYIGPIVGASVGPDTLAVLGFGKEVTFGRMTSTQTQTLDAKTFLRLIEGGKNNLRVHEDAVNDLNVFPIPDGDTGANMSMTVEGGLGAVRADSCDTLGDAAQQLANGMLMSARGNSGVILSQLFAGFATALSGKETADIAELSEALETGVRFAYDSVAVPTEGTILTVAREAACAASHICEKETLEEFWQIYTDELQASLQRTPELLPVLKEAGVIDSGGAGLYYIADGIRRAFRGESIDVQSPEAYGQKVRVDFANFNENSIMTYGYCTELLLRLQHAKTDISAFSADELVKKLGAMGNSIVAFKNGSIVKVHIHTMTPGEILNYCQQFGEFLTVKIENMTLQHQDTLMEKAVEPDKPRDEKKKFALVTVASGAGIREAFLQLGADVVLDGRQTQNPAAADFIRAFDEANAETIFVLPNNSNIFLTAKQAGELYEDADIRVLNSRNIGEGYAALSMLSYDSGDADTVAALLSSAMQGVETGMISRAVRDSVCNGVRVKKDDFIALAEGTVLGASDDRLGAAMALLEKLQTRQHEILIAVYGADFPAEERAKFREAVASVYRNTELCELDGEQSIYDLIVIVE